MNIVKTLLCLSLLTFSTIGFSQNDLKRLPDVEVKTLDGQTLNLADFGKNGKITVISFWATWCTPCKKELDAIADFYPDWKEEYDCELLAVTIDNSRQLAKVPVMVETKQWEYTVLAGDQNAVQTAFNFQTIPQTFLVDQEGNVVYTHSGYVPGDEYGLEEEIKKLAGK
ncbi:MAG: TlpA family protein disulfide reductase [Saprospiraceae bacterium]|nr:TlpA family protein disulfide reductase [Saprospiraceae bacterium]